MDTVYIHTQWTTVKQWDDFHTRWRFVHGLLRVASTMGESLIWQPAIYWAHSMGP